jgi:hypothetical protein
MDDNMAEGFRMNAVHLRRIDRARNTQRFYRLGAPILRGSPRASPRQSARRERRIWGDGGGGGLLGAAAAFGATSKAILGAVLMSYTPTTVPCADVSAMKP